MKILLLNPPFKPEHGRFSREQRSPAITKSGTFYYPMWLAYAAGFLEAQGHECVLLDAPAKRASWDELEPKVREFAPEMAVIDTSTPSISNDIYVAAKLKDATNAFTVLVGPHVSALPEEALASSPAVDAVARREYEHTLADLTSALESGRGLGTVAGISYREGEAIRRNPDREPCRDLDSIPFVSRSYKRHLDYRDYFYAHSRAPIVTTVTARGCPHECVYCVYPQVFNGRKVRYRSIENVLDEVEYILREFPAVREIMFEDDTLTVNKMRSMEFAEAVLSKGLRFRWSANSRADVDLETMVCLKRAGCRLFCVGVESGSQEMLDRMKKRLKVERIRRFFKDARKAGIMVHGCFLLGNPGETMDTMEETLMFAVELDPDTAQFFPIMVYPGTEAYRWAEVRGYIKARRFDDWLTGDGLHNCVLSRPGLTDMELVAFCDRARREFYTRPGYILRKVAQAAREPGEFGRLIKGGATLARHLWRGTYRQGAVRGASACKQTGGR